MIRNFFLLSLVFMLNSCLISNLTINTKSDLKLKQVSFNDLPGWQKDEQNKAVISFVNSCQGLSKMPANKKVGGAIDNMVAADFKDVCKIAPVIKDMGDAQARNFFENWFVPFEVSSKSSGSQGLFTGYYIPEIKGSKTRSNRYQYPVYAKPKDLKSLNLTRAQIDSGALQYQGLELAWVEDPIDLFFMQVQGSGRILMEDGSIMKLNFAAKNNYPYSSIGKYIVDNKLIAGDTSYFAIRNWLKQNPEQARKAMNVNQSYVFFKPSNSDDVFGSSGAKLMAERSMAVDNDIIPTGVPLWLNSKSSNYQKLLVAQDTGSAIKGAVRGDIFFGRGESAEILAASMNYKGKYYILLPTAAVDRIVGR